MSAASGHVADAGAGVGAGGGAVSVEPHVQGLSPGTVYHYRLVVQSAVRGEPFVSGELSFLTQQSLSGPLLAVGVRGNWCPRLISVAAHFGDRRKLGGEARRAVGRSLSRAPRLRRRPGVYESSRCSSKRLERLVFAGVPPASQPGGDGARRGV